MRTNSYDMNSYKIVLSKFFKLEVNRPCNFLGSSEEQYNTLTETLGRACINIGP